MKIFGVPILVLLLASSCSHTSQRANILKHNEYAFLVKDGYAVICKYATPTYCGLTLTNCTDEFKYYCTTGVTITDASKILIENENEH